MSDLEDLEEIARQTTIAVNKHDRSGRGAGNRFKAGHLSHIPENIARAAVRVERSKPAPAPVVDQAVSIEAPRVQILEVTTYTELVEVLRTRVGNLGVRYQDFDQLAGFPDGLSGKVFGPSQVKRLGIEKAFDAMRAAGLRIRLEEDPEQTAKMQARIAENFNPRQANQARMNNEASPAGRHMMGRVFRHFAKLGGKARMAKMTKKELREHQRKAAMAGVKKRRKEEKRRARQRAAAHKARKAAAE